MSSAPHRSVRAAPPRPLLIFDGNCHFCRRWIERWRELTAGAVEYAPSQEVAERFPEIPGEAFERSVQFIDTDGTVFSGAEAVFRSLGKKRSRRWMIWCYEHVPGFGVITDTAYRLVARHRMTASFFTRLLWGNDVRQPTYFKSRRWFLRSLGCIYLIAFLSLWTQVDGLIGEHGISPVAKYLPAAHDQIGGSAPFLLPTLCWLNSSNAFLHFLCGAGAVISVLLIAGFLPVIALVLLFVLYLSLTIAGQTFLSFQWDILLLETGFLAIFFAPVRWRLGAASDAPVSRIGQFLLKLLLFKLMLMSGVVKLTSGDNSWWNLTALDYHYETQPLPTIIGWWAHQSPEWFRKFSTFFVLFVESVTPFFIWAPRRLRHIACALLIHAGWPLQHVWIDSGPVVAPKLTPVERALSATPSKALLVSNAPDQAYLATGHDALVMPGIVDYLTGRTNDALQQDLQQLAEALRQHGGYVFWKQTLDPIATPEQLGTHVHLYLIAAEPSEALYQVLPG